MKSFGRVRNRILVGFVLIVVAAIWVWETRSISIEIAGTSFRFPADAVISSHQARAVSGLDQNQGAYIVLPKGPYFGQWGLLLQSSHDRRGDGMPIGFKDALKKNEVSFAKNEFGWFVCDAKCGPETWIFRHVPNKSDSTYSVGTAICFETDICKLFLSYRNIDVQVSLKREHIGEAPELLSAVGKVLAKFEAP